MKKSILSSLVLSVLISAKAFAQPAYVQVIDYDAAAIMGALISSGEKFIKESDSRYVLDINNLACVSLSNGPLEGVMGGIGQTDCYKDSDVNNVFARKGKRLGESNEIESQIEKQIEGAKAADGSPLNLLFMDCAMGGRCGGALKQVHCVVNPTIEMYRGQGRFLCKLFLVPESAI